MSTYVAVLAQFSVVAFATHSNNKSNNNNNNNNNNRTKHIHVPSPLKDKVLFVATSFPFV
jgi:hypothetical protein